jgi:ABC-type lipoprotein release transport system permease subunit
MRLALTLAWRNLWRNTRRTGITTASVVMAVVLSTVMGSMQQGQYDQMIDNTVGAFTGHLQIQAEGYLDEPTLDRSMDHVEVPAHSEIRAVVPRLDTYALASGEARSRAAMVVGIDIEAERDLSAPHAKLVQGRYFDDGAERGVLVAQGLADALDLALGDSLILLGSGYQGQSAFGLYPVVGILQFGVPELNLSMVYLPLEAAQEFTAAYGRVTTISVLLHHPAKMAKVARDIQSELPDGLVALDWPVLMPELVQAIQADRGSSYIILMILYMVVGFGILGTVVMMTAERKYELGVMLSIGTSRGLLMRMLILEMAFITMMGTVIGIVLSLPVLLWYHWNPLEFKGEMADAIMEYGMEPFIRFSLDPAIPLIQGAVILVLTALISLQPVIHMRKLDAVSSMRR